MSDSNVDATIEPLYELVLERSLPLADAGEVAERIAATSQLPATKVAKLLTKPEGSVLTKPTRRETLVDVQARFEAAGAKTRILVAGEADGHHAADRPAGPGSVSAHEASDRAAVGQRPEPALSNRVPPRSPDPSSKEGRLRRRDEPKYYGGQPVAAPSSSRWHAVLAAMLTIGSFAGLVAVFLPYLHTEAGTTSFLGGGGAGAGWVIVLIVAGLFAGLFQRRWLGVTLFVAALAIVMLDYLAVWSTLEGSPMRGLIDIAPTRLPDLAAGASDARLSSGWTVMVTSLAVAIVSCIGIPRRAA